MNINQVTTPVKKGHKYTHPVSGKVEILGGSTVLWTFLFGPVYFAYKEVWKHALIEFVAGVALACTGIGILALPALWGAYAFFACDILRSHYKDRGYKEEDLR